MGVDVGVEGPRLVVAVVVFVDVDVGLVVSMMVGVGV